jgi:predicted nucleotide-binding protein
MATRKNTTPPPKETAMLIISNADFVSKLEKRIEIGEELFNRTISTQDGLTTANSDYKLWTEYNFEMLKQVFNIENNDYKSSYVNAGYNMMVGQLGEVQGNPGQSFKNKVKYKLDNLKSLLTRTELLKSQVNNNAHISVATPTKTLSKTEVFIVHGHDEAAKTKTARFIEKLGLKPIILHEQASGSKTVIEKIEAYSNVGFGIVLYTPCDIGAKKEANHNLKNRARQNVVFEHGFLIGKIGRENVCALVKDEIETPNDISGVVYVKMDDEDAWHIKIARELRNSGYDIDMNKL